MPPFARPLLNHLRHPTTLSIFGISLFSPSRSISSLPSSSATCTRYLIRQPSPTATRECPTPLILVRALGLGSQSSSASGTEEEIWTDWSSMFAEKGYTAVEINIAAPTHPPSPPSSSSTSHGPFSSMTSLLASQIRLLAIPFPPILVGEGMTCLLTQSYVSDNPASGLVMLNPPPDTDIRINAEREREGGWEWPTFNYEPRFPILVLADEGRMKGLKEGSRVARAAEGGVWRGGKGVSVEVMGEGDERGEETRVTVERWMDSCGF